jgi:spoIIIJ-associated protein
MEWVETTGRTVDEAKGRALDQLGVDDLDAEFEIVEEPRPGLFGRVRGEARVRARVRPTAPRPKVDRRDRRRKRDDASAAPNPNGETADVAPPRPTTARTDKAPAAPARTTEAPAHEETTMSDGDNETDSAEVEAGANTFLTGLLDAFGINATVSAHHPADGEIEMAIEGDELGLLVGPKGQTLMAIQDLTRLAAQRRVGPGSPRLAVDVGGYRQRRVEALGRFSRQVAQQVVESGLPKSLEPMVAADRKVVHDALTDVAGVATVSEGEDPYRRVVIVPEPAS